MKIYLLTLLILLATLSCNCVAKKQAITTDKNAVEEMETEQRRLRYLALGDSYTIGEGVDSTLRYPVQIADSLKALGYLMKSPEIITVTGWTTSNLKAAIKTANPQPPQICPFQINNCLSQSLIIKFALHGDLTLHLHETRFLYIPILQNIAVHITADRYSGYISYIHQQGNTCYHISEGCPDHNRCNPHNMVAQHPPVICE